MTRMNNQENNEKIPPEMLKQMVTTIRQAQNILVYSGAGVGDSAQLPGSQTEDDALRKTDPADKYSPQQLQSSSLLYQDPAAVYDFLYKYVYSQERRPTISHRFTRGLENLGKDVIVVSENMDNLHQLAGSSKVLDLYGNRYDFYCTECQKHYTMDQLELDDAGVPRCAKDQGLIRSTAICLDERPNEAVLGEIAEAFKNCDLLLVLATSIHQRPLSLLLKFFQGNNIINIDHSAVRNYAGKKVLIFKSRLRPVLEQAWEGLTADSKSGQDQAGKA